MAHLELVGSSFSISRSRTKTKFPKRKKEPKIKSYRTERRNSRKEGEIPTIFSLFLPNCTCVTAGHSTVISIETKKNTNKQTDTGFSVSFFNYH